MTFNEFVQKCIDASSLSLEVQVDLHFNRMFHDTDGVKRPFSVSILERETEQQDFKVVHDIDAFIAPNLSVLPLNPMGRFQVQALSQFKNSVRRCEFGTVIIEGDKVEVKRIPHTIVFTTANEALLNCHIFFPAMYDPEQRKHFFFGNPEQEFFFNNLFLKAAKRVCDPTVLVRVCRSHRHAMSSGFSPYHGEFMTGYDIMNITQEMRRMVDSDGSLNMYKDFFFSMSSFGFKQRFNGVVSDILSPLIDWNLINRRDVYLDFAANIYNTNNNKIMFVPDGKIKQIGALYGVHQDESYSFHSHALSKFGGFSVEPVIVGGEGANTPSKLIFYSDIKNAFTGPKPFDVVSGYYGKFWKPQDLWGDNDRNIAAVNVSNIK